MLHTTLQQVSQAFPKAQFAMVPNTKHAPYKNRASLGLLQKASYHKFGIQWDFLGKWIPQKLRSLYGVVTDKEIDVVLDAAGFAYGDQWGPQNCVHLARLTKRWKAQGTKVILLPQALGPFKSPANKAAIKSVAENADLIFARERVSYGHLISIVGERENIKLAPDFTNITPGIVPPTFDSSDKKFCIIPNQKMIEKTSSRESSAYLPFLTKCADYLFKRGAKPFILIHEGEGDTRLAQKVISSLDQPIPLFKETDPLKIKGILGICDGTIGSRFHGLVSSLSQGVPSLGTAWSHKYQMLFEDYDFAEGLISTQISEEGLYKKIDLLLNIESRTKIQERILKKSKQEIAKTIDMWRIVLDLIGDKKD